jgi:hypothetical protein
VVWVQGRFAGVAFDQQLRPEEVLRNIPSLRPKAKLELKRPGFTTRPLTDYERKMLETWLGLPPPAQAAK